MPDVEPRILKGFRDYLPEIQVPKERMLRSIADVFESFGYAPLQTPALEYAEILLGKCGEEGDKLLYRFADHGGRDVALRYDLTVPLARLVGQYGEIDLPFKRYQIAPVWRAEKPARGRFREFVQCDVDVAGTASLLADVETLQVACAVLDRLGVRGYRIRVSNRKILTGLLATIGVGEGPAGMGVIRTIDKLDKLDRDGVVRLLREENGLAERAIERIFEFLGMGGADDSETAARVREYFRGVESGERGADELAEVVGHCNAVGIAERVRIDLTLARGMDYYTGTIAEGVLTDLPGFGSVLGGGRYDNLVGVFRGSPVPAVGISIGVDRLLAGLRELGLVAEVATPTEVLVTIFDPSGVPEALRLARDLRAAGLRVELFHEPAKIGKQIRYADRRGVPFVAIQGPDERQRGEVSIKDLRGGSQSTVGCDRAAAWLVERLRDAGDRGARP